MSAWALSGRKQQRGREGLEQEAKKPSSCVTQEIEKRVLQPQPRSPTSSDHGLFLLCLRCEAGQGTCWFSGTRNKPSDPCPSLPTTLRSDPPGVPASQGFEYKSGQGGCGSPAWLWGLMSTTLHADISAP